MKKLNSVFVLLPSLFPIFASMLFRLLAVLSILSACSQAPVNNTLMSDSTSVNLPDSLSVSDSMSSSKAVLDSSANTYYGNDMMQTYFVIVADTARDYFKLRHSMFELANASDLMIDTFGRYHDPKRGIILPDDSDDESYAGTYYPRRFEGSELSIEYYNNYSDKTLQNTMALIAGQYTELYNAQKQLKKIRSVFPKAYIVQSLLYNGCMH